ncbi:MAG: hypothetical protein GWN77_01090 [Gammaproteobacteria bacterium]|nr:hypothetical protein [Desulfobacterales bacterium]NIR25578.1 hypothetical protein [Gammaproteobacteria bacterium]NIV68492.1 hypothetical protein [Candidatus Bathyarchaeota archaeon]
MDYYRKYDKLPPDNVLWFHGLELMDHLCKGDWEQTYWKNKYPIYEYLDIMRDAMSNRNVDPQFQEIVENSYCPKEQWAETWDEQGQFDLDSWLSGEEQCFIETERQYDLGDAVSVLMSVNVPYCDVNKTYMVDRQRKVYEVVAKCDSENRPCRVIAVKNEILQEIHDDTLKIFTVIKDYDDPIFPAIWGCFWDNETTNAYANCFSDYFLGTHSWGNGTPTSLKNASQYFPEDEHLIVFGDDIDLGIIA